MSKPSLVSKKAESIVTSATLELAAAAAARKARGQDIIAFTAGEPDLPVPADVNLAANRAIEENRGRYTAAAGLPELRKAIAARFRAQGYNFEPDQVMATAGAKPAIYHALFALLNPGDEVIFPAPFWGSYTELAKAAGGIPVPVMTRCEEGFQPSATQIRAALTPRSRVLLLNSPNNPTGAIYGRKTLEALADLVRERQLVVLSDDIYDALVYTDTPFLNILHVAPDLADRVLVINSLSKSHSMTGWRFGFVGGPKEVIEAMGRVQSQISGSPSTIAQLASMTALAGTVDPERIRSLDRRRRLLLDELATIPELPCAIPGGAFYVFPSVRAYLGRRFEGKVIESSSHLATLLLDHALVATIPGEAFGAPGHLRLTYTVPEREIPEGVRRIKAFLALLR